MRVSPDNRFELHHYSHDDESYQYSYTTNYWFVRSVETGDELYQFEGTDNEDREGRSRDGTEAVSFSPDGSVLMVTNSDDTRIEYSLPQQIVCIEQGKRIRLTYADGKIEERDRKRMVHFTKYGQPTSYPIVDDPSHSEA